MKATAKAPANIAFIKYWGKVDESTRVPSNNSISMNLSEMYTTTTVEFSTALQSDDVTFAEEEVVTDKERSRIISAMDAIRTRAGQKSFAKVVTRNSFPKATGIASSASGFASLAAAGFAACAVKLGEEELSKFCRMLSGTACRSIPSGFVEWKQGSGPEDSFAYQLYSEEYWDICDVIAIVTRNMKKVSSSDGHALADTSPFYQVRIEKMGEKIRAIKHEMQEKNFPDFGRILEDEALNMHAICFTSTPPLMYWEPPTVDIMRKVMAWREENRVESYFTIDAGPSVHVICRGSDALIVQRLLSAISGVQQVVINRPAQGARIIENHLF